MKKGLTLIEVLVVVFLIGLVLSTAVFIMPRYRDYVAFSVELSKFNNNLRYAREMSVAEQKNHAVRFIYEDNKYHVIKYTEEGEDLLKTEFFDGGVKLIDVDNYFEAKFTLFGAVFKAGKVKLKSNNHEKIIHIKPSGFIKR